MRFIITLLLLLVAAVPSFAQTKILPFDRPFVAAAGGGITVPTGDFKDVFKNGLHVYVGGGVPLQDYLAAIAKIEYVEHELDPKIGISQGKGADFLSLMFGVDLVVNPPSGGPIQPFGFIGGGFASVTIEEFETESYTVGEIQKTKFYFNFGAGVAFHQFGPFAVFIEARYVVQEMPGQLVTNPKEESYKSIPISVGIRF